MVRVKIGQKAWGRYLKKVVNRGRIPLRTLVTTE